MSNFSDVEIDLSAENQKELIQLYVRDNLKPESQSVFKEQLLAGSDDLVFCNALYHAVLNDMVVSCIELAIKTEAEDDI